MREHSLTASVPPGGLASPKPSGGGKPGPETVVTFLSAPAFEALVRPRAWPKLALPLATGIAAAIGAGYMLMPAAVALVALFLVGDAMFIFGSNDLVDEEADRVRRAREETPSPKVLLDGVLSRRALALGALVGAALVLLAGQALARLTGQRAPVVLAMAAVLCVAVYEFRPLRLNYRGGGELVEAVGVGIVLPLFGAASQGAGAPRALAALLPALVGVSLAGALASTVADAPADALAGKRTFAVRFGALPTARAAALTLTLSSLAALAVSLVGRPSASLVAIALGATVGGVVRAARAWNGEDHAALAAFKGAVRRAVLAAWSSATLGFALDRALAGVAS
jgi:1,4-dihydroxy-2-naphthoate octaprenyltransferase